MVTTERYKTALLIKHLKEGLAAIVNYTTMQPENLPKAKAMLNVIGCLARETLDEAAMPLET